ncbi:S8 family serine peptidase [uncultured Nocardioides sp.]|uniref:S8 family serine peptidase n=1 Tax=uncultured Nocardioides sp. TaxID=198441 RepID=UPI00261B1993|nr:S8 family serine peptidase [uncultured Nocardioides sp.]
MSARRPLLAASLTAGLLVVLTTPLAASAGEEQDGPVAQVVACSATVGEEQVFVNQEQSRPLEQMRIGEAQEVATGDGVTVAVIDAAIPPVTPVPLGERLDLQDGEITVEHGSVVAGLIAGAPRTGEDGTELATGIAPDATILPVRVVGPIDPEEAGEVPEFETADVVAGLQWVADEADRLGIDVVNLSLNVEEDVPEMRDAVRAVQQAGVIVVAATANRDGEELPEAPTPAPLEDGVYPAAYPGVVGVTTYVPLFDESGEPIVPESVIKGSRFIDVAAPTQFAISYGPNGSSCMVDAPAASWATAYVSGVLALLEQAFPRETPDELVARLVDTASGVPDQRSTLSGAGVVQPLEALTREVDTDRKGRLQVPEQVDDSDGGRAAPPPVRTDELAESRSDFRWWGLLAGAVLVGAVILRPLLRRIRRS